ncbi:hypothetical protein Tco_1261887 [Tanacetum coccineum]
MSNTNNNSQTQTSNALHNAITKAGGKDLLPIIHHTSSNRLRRLFQLQKVVLKQLQKNALHNAIMKAGGKDRPPMLAPGNYVQWKSIIKRYIDTKPNNELIHYCLQNPPYMFKWTEKTVPVAEGSSETTTEGYMENYKNISQEIRDQLNAETEVVQIILIGIDNDIYSTVDPCPNACEM